MGCATSRARNEDTVRRCRDRRNLMNTTIQSLHHLASAHAAYLHSLRHTATAFTVFSSGEPLAVSDLTPPIFIQHPVSPSPQKPVGLENEEDGRNLVQKKDVEVRMVVRHRNLAEIAAAIAECFVKASVAGEAVLELLKYGQEEKSELDIFISAKFNFLINLVIFLDMHTRWILEIPLISIMYSCCLLLVKLYIYNFHAKKI